MVKMQCYAVELGDGDGGYASMADAYIYTYCKCYHFNL